MQPRLNSGRTRRAMLGASLGVLLSPGWRSATAAEFPNRPIKLVVPYPAGGVVDGVARQLSARLAELLGQAILIDNRGGAGGTIGTAELAKSAPDGYTIGLIYDSHVVNPIFYPQAPYDALNDFGFISQIVAAPMVLVAHPGLPAATLKELVALSKACPGTLNYGSPGSGSSNHLVMERLKLATGLDAQHIPYRGGAPAVADILGGHLQLMFANPSTVLPHLHSGKMKALGVSSSERASALPDVPTLEESGARGFDVRAWIGMVAPARTPKEVVGRLHGAVTRALRDPPIRKALAEAVFDVVGSSPSQFEQLARADSARWAKVVRDAQIRVE